MVDEAAFSVGELLSSQLQCSELMLLFHSAGRNSNGGLSNPWMQLVGFTIFFPRNDRGAISYN